MEQQKHQNLKSIYIQNVHKNELKANRTLRKSTEFKRLTEADTRYFMKKCWFHRLPILALWIAKTKTLNTIVKKQVNNYIKDICLEILGKSALSNDSTAHHI